MQKQNLPTYLLLTALLALLPVRAAAQTLAQAQTLFKEGRYAEAKPVFEKYVARVPANGNYNLWYGACCLRTGEAEKAVRHLEVAVKKRIPSGQLWLGQAYDATYRYEDAISTLEDYAAELKRRRRSTGVADSLLTLCRTHLRMLKGVERVCVVDSFTVDKARFLEAYRLSPQTGRLCPYDGYYPTSGRTGTTVHENELGNKTYYSEANDKGVQQLRTRNLLAGEWSAGMPLEGDFPDSTDTAYPFLMPDGVTLYYASRGAESLGGYDIFVTRYNTNTDAYLRPGQPGLVCLRPPPARRARLRLRLHPQPHEGSLRLRADGSRAPALAGSPPRPARHVGRPRAGGRGTSPPGRRGARPADGGRTPPRLHLRGGRPADVSRGVGLPLAPGPGPAPAIRAGAEDPAPPTLTPGRPARRLRPSL